MRMSARKNRGFTLVELLLVIMILAALAAIAVPRMVTSSHEAKVAACNTHVDIINSQIEAYLVQTGTSLADFDAAAFTALLNNTGYFPDGPPTCPFGTAYTLNTITKHANPHTH